VSAVASDIDSVAAARRGVRALIAESGMTRYAQCDAWMRGHDLAFTKELAAHHLIGLTWPREFGGRDASNVERLVVTEELLRVGAPVAAHWIADRQIGPAILRHGSPALQEQFLPRIAAGEVTFCLGMSETESGSDLAAVRTRAVQDGDTFRITGRKIWTSHAHRSTHAYVLARTGDAADRHESLTEFVVDLASPGVEVRPIYDLAGEHHFNEMTFDEVEVPAENVIGQVGNGWTQVTEQLAFERGGMERVLSTFPLLARAFEQDERSSVDPTALGDLIARLHTLRAMALGIAGAMDAGEAPVQKAAMLKYLGTAFEGDVVEFARDALRLSPDPSAGGIEGLLAAGITASPGATLRGGATEVLLGILGRQELSGSSAGTRRGSSELRSVVDDVLSGLPRASITELGEVWRTAVTLGWTGIGTAEDAGGSGGELRDLADIAESLARHGHSVPVVDSALAARIRSTSRPTDPNQQTALGLGTGLIVEERDGHLIVRGTVARVPWARSATSIVVAATGMGGEVLLEVALAERGIVIEHGGNLAGEPRDTVTFNGVRLSAEAKCGDQAAVDRARRETAILHGAAILGALDAAVSSPREHVQIRHQFGKPLAAFQAVAHTIARMAAEHAGAEVAVAQGLTEAEIGGPGWRIAASSIMTARAATAVAKSAHQVLGAMGITREHDLHLATLRLWSWRDEIVPERTMARRLGQTALAAGQDQTWAWCVHETDQLGADLARTPWRTH
jgi:alkylation response protein AidB-like acyl-CoA dehydrogenase